VVPIPTVVWFHNDITTRLKAHPDVALTHGLLWGQEALRELLASRASKEEGSSGKRRIQEEPTFNSTVSALLAFFGKQYNDEKNLKFRQAGFDRVDLLDSFTDVPLAFRADPSRSILREWTKLFHARQDYEGRYLDPDGVYTSAAATAAQYLLADSPAFRNSLIEGAPGQGKSTVTQYVCQTHRVRLLGKTDDADRLRQSDKYSVVRLPFKIELRKYASWYRDREAEGHGSDSGVLCYLQVLVNQVSQLNVPISSIVSVLQGSPSIFVFDGLDEIAEVDVRRSVVNSIESLVNSLGVWECDYKSVVTSRPATTLDLPSMSEENTVHLALVDLPPAVTREYADRWIALRELPDDEASNLKEIFEDAVKREHVADLARNPMQLAILLYLINTKGWSLPDKRTDLYQAYIDTFLDRESEKSVSVRNNVPLLLELHGYIAWLLHTRAESAKDPQKSRGDISRDELVKVFRDFLAHEGHPTDLVDSLIAGTQRFFVLVERDQGRFEFEVQPLREFFVGRYLYQSSPDDRATLGVTGGKPERFEALMRNRYWLNALRFYCGYYQKGELPDLTRRLCELLDPMDPTGHAHAYEVMEAILRDYSIASSPRDTADLVTVLTTAQGLTYFGRDATVRLQTNTSFTPLRKELGRSTLVKRVRECIRGEYPGDFINRLARFLRAHDDDVASWWFGEYNVLGTAESRSRFLRIGSASGALRKLPRDDALSVCNPERLPDGDPAWLRLLESDRSDIMLAGEAYLERAMQGLLNGPAIPSTIRPASDQWLAVAKLCCNPIMWDQVHYRFAEDFLPKEGELVFDEAASEDLRARARDFTETVMEALRMRCRTWSGKHGAWDGAIGILERAFPDAWLTWRTACQGALDLGRSPDAKSLTAETLKTTSEWFSADLSSQEIVAEAIKSCVAGQRMATAAAAVCLAPTDRFLDVARPLDELLNSFSQDEMSEVRSFALRLSLNDGYSIGRHRALTADEVEGLRLFGARLQLCSLPRIKTKDREPIVDRLCDLEPPGFQQFVDEELVFALGRRLKQVRGGEMTLCQLRDRFKLTEGLTATFMATRTQALAWAEWGGSNEIISTVLKDPYLYPWPLVSNMNQYAIMRMRQVALPLRSQADRENWFPHDADRAQ